MGEQTITLDGKAPEAPLQYNATRLNQLEGQTCWQYLSLTKIALCCIKPLVDAERFCCRAANFNNPHHNVGLPVFTIHGNHDDPAGADNLSAVDVLSSCKLVNYFGKAVCSLL